MDNIAYAKEWVKYANEDEVVFHLLFNSKLDLTFTYPFHAQQAAEKWLKALLVLQGIEPPKTHDLGKITQLLEEYYPEMIDSIWDFHAGVLNRCAVEDRYPGWDELEDNIPDDDLILNALQAVKAFVFKHLPWEQAQ